MAHTPGPWRYEPEAANRGDAFDRFSISGGIANEEGELQLDITDFMTQADASLIAAAPDLLAIVKEMVEVIEWSEKRTRPHWDGSVSENSTLGRARAAIARAEPPKDPK